MLFEFWGLRWIRLRSRASSKTVRTQEAHKSREDGRFAAVEGTGGSQKSSGTKGSQKSRGRKARRGREDGRLAEVERTKGTQKSRGRKARRGPASAATSPPSGFEAGYGSLGDRERPYTEAFSLTNSSVDPLYTPMPVCTYFVWSIINVVINSCPAILRYGSCYIRTNIRPAEPMSIQ